MSVQTVKTVGGYFWGAPVWGKAASIEDIIAHLRLLLATQNANPASWAEVDNYIYAYYGRLTDKCAALLQTVAVIAALESIFVAQDLASGSPSIVLGYSALGSFLVCALLLAFNLSVYWPRHAIKQGDNVEDGQAVWRHSLIKKVQERTWKHNAAVFFLLLGIVFSITDRAVALTGYWPLAPAEVEQGSAGAEAPVQAPPTTTVPAEPATPAPLEAAPTSEASPPPPAPARRREPSPEPGPAQAEPPADESAMPPAQSPAVEPPSAETTPIQTPPANDGVSEPAPNEAPPAT